MGCCQSNEVHDGKARNEEIDNQLKRDKLNMRNEVKMLLLGKKISPSIFVLYPWFLTPLFFRRGRIRQIHHFKANEINP